MVISIIQILILYHYPVDLLTFLELYFKKKVLSVWKWGNSDLLTPFVKAILSGWRAFKSKENRLFWKKEDNFTLNSNYIYPCSCFQFTVNIIPRNKTKNCPRRLPRGGGLCGMKQLRVRPCPMRFLLFCFVCLFVCFWLQGAWEKAFSAFSPPACGQKTQKTTTTTTTTTTTKKQASFPFVNGRSHFSDAFHFSLHESLSFQFWS